MFNKKICDNCHGKLKDSYNFCPHCGIQLKKPSEEYGMLGKKDKKTKLPEPKIFGGGISGNIMNKMLGGALKMLEKEMTKEMAEDQKIPTMSGFPNTKVRLVVNGKEISPQSMTQKDKTQKDNVKILPIEFSDKNLKKWTTLKKTEPPTKLKRIGDKIEYELDIPEVKSIKDISIIKLEKSIEIKAIAEKKAYKKTISIDLPLKKYTLINEKLILELDASM